MLVLIVCCICLIFFSINMWSFSTLFEGKLEQVGWVRKFLCLKEICGDPASMKGLKLSEWQWKGRASSKKKVHRSQKCTNHMIVPYRKCKIPLHRQELSFLSKFRDFFSIQKLWIENNFTRHNFLCFSLSFHHIGKSNFLVNFLLTWPLCFLHTFVLWLSNLTFSQVDGEEMWFWGFFKVKKDYLLSLRQFNNEWSKGCWED